MIKSKKAKHYIDVECTNAMNEQIGNQDVVLYSSAVEAIQKAESELYSEEQCIEAYANLCQFKRGDVCRLSDFHTACQNIKDCTTKTDFLSALKSLKQ